MKITVLEYSECKVYNPVKNDVVVGDACNEDSPSLIAYWHDACFPDALIKDKELEERWKQYLIDIDDVPDTDYLRIFLEEYDNSDWIVYIISGYGVGCGMASDTVWLVVDKNTIVEEIE